MRESVIKKSYAFTLMELMVVMAIVSILIVGASILFSGGVETWASTEGHIHLHENVRQVLKWVGRELRQADSAHAQILNGVGPGNSDTITVSIPVICEAGQGLVDSSGSIAHWGAPLIWGCTDSSCMDADDDCSTVDYKYIQYGIDDQDQFIRRVMDDIGTLVSEQVFASNIKDLQFTISGSVITMTVSAEITTPRRRTLTAQTSVDVYLRN